MFTRPAAATTAVAVSVLTALGAVYAHTAEASPGAAASSTASSTAMSRASGVSTASALAGAPATQPAAVARKGRPGAAAQRYLGTSASAHVWHSGAWVGGWMNAARAARWGTWRGTPSDVTLTFPERGTWAQLADSTWHIDTFKGFRGRLVYGLPLLPDTAKPADLKAVAAGRQDAVFRKVARDLRTRGRGNSVVRIGWEANGTWMPYSVTTANAADYRAAFRRVATVMNKESPALLFSFDINCGTQLRGQTSRLDSLTRLYPGDDVVDVVGCSTYDWDVIGATTEASWRRALAPTKAVGVGDIAAFARARGKGMAISEWGLARTSRDGHGDNPFYLAKMKQFFDANNDVLVLESYFNAPEDHMRNSLWTEAPQNPKAAAVYRRLW